jgi:hypothetical protein
MKEQIKIVPSKRNSQLNIEQFKKSARVVYEKQVKPQIKRASETRLPNEVVVCNNPV